MQQIKIGSAPANNIVLNHPTVSPFHLEIVQDDQGNFLLTDLNSTYGTTVNGYRIQGMVQLRKTDIVKAGELVLPWTTYFQYSNVVPPTTEIPSPVAMPMQTPNFSNPAVPPPNAKKPMSKKTLFMIVGGGALVVILGIIGLIYMYTRPSYAHLKLIPSNAFMVTSIDFKSIAGKIDVEKLKNMEFFADMKDRARDQSNELSKAMGDPISSGIDIFSQPYAFMTVENSDYMRYSGGVVFAIKNQDDFHKFVSRLSHEDEIQQSEKFYFMRLDNGGCIAWNDDAGLLLFSDKSKSRTENYCRSLFEQSEKESILGVETFDKFKKAQYDIGFFINYDAIRGIPGVSIPAYMRGSATMASIVFDNGKLSYTSEFIPNPTDPDAPKSMLGKKGINDGLKAAIPGKSYGVASVSVDLNEIYKFMDKDARMSDMLDEVARNFRLEKKQLPGIFGGDFFGGLSDVKQMIIPSMRYNYNYDTYDYEYVEVQDTSLMPSYVFGATVKDKTAFEGLMQNWGGKDTLNGIKFWTTWRQGNYYLANNASNYFFTNDFALAKELSTGKASTQVSGSMAQNISNVPVYSYFNLNLSKYPKEVPDALEKSMRYEYNDFKTAVSMLDYVEMTGDGSKQNIDIYFTDKGNSLMTMFKTGNDIYLNHSH
jgi:hypothetical protein